MCSGGTLNGGFTVYLVMPVILRIGNCYFTFCNYFEVYPCFVGPCYNGMACSWVVDGEDNLQIWRVAVNILNKQSWTANKGWNISLGAFAASELDVVFSGYQPC
jgi:hypothetical protein